MKRLGYTIVCVAAIAALFVFGIPFAEKSPMIDCANATDLLGIGVAFNGVIAAISQTGREIRRVYISAVIRSVRENYPELNPIHLRGRYFEDRAFAKIPDLKGMLLISVVIRVYALAITLISVATLAQYAYWGDACKINGIYFAIYLLFSLVLGPCVYWLYQYILQFSTDELAEYSFDHVMDQFVDEIKERERQRAERSDNSCA